MTAEEMIEKYFVYDDEMYRPKDDYIIQLDFFSVDYISFIEGDMVYSMVSDNKYSLQKIDMDCIKVFRRI